MTPNSGEDFEDTDRIGGTVFGFADIEWRDSVIRDLREALKFYADEKNYQQPGVRSGEWWTITSDKSPVDSDNGKIARAALEQKR